ncbi:hypothetical protein D6853_11270 [Butyrivibrio sp. X503]|uniref:hypothetical protein n=1 Tax=Butyrivibrio sp. X503 TaxID=2364878 RepID=UPI000EA96B25|nr:hypothetical protein [Butyrivibrio sp. X503]RKM55291.1 hypothetical protein D6853_11270 [Butyrivibrio sp. X503]
MKKIGSVLFTCILIALAWIICGLVCADYKVFSLYYWLAFGFGLLILIVVSIANALLKSGSTATYEVNSLPAVYSFAYLLIGLLFNIIFMVQPFVAYKNVLIIVNVILLLLYVLAVSFSARYADRVAGQLDLTAAKTANMAEIASLLARLLSQAKDEEVRKKLYSFKEKVDYSTNISQGFTADLEEELIESLRNIGRGLDEGISKEQILSKIDNAEQIFGMRNAKISTVR